MVERRGSASPLSFYSLSEKSKRHAQFRIVRHEQFARQNAPKAYASKGRPLAEKHKRAILEGCIRAKIMRELAAQGRRVLGEISTDRLALKVTREGLHAQLARLPAERSRAAEITKLQRLVFNAEGFADGWRLGDDGHGIVTASDRELLKAWVDVLGPPIFRRPTKYGKRWLSVSWPLIYTVRPAPAPDYYTESVSA